MDVGGLQNLSPDLLLRRDPAAALRGDPADASRRFQALLATMLVKEMRRALPEGFFGSKAEGDVYAGWLDQHLGEALAARDALHVDALLRAGIERKAADQGEAR